jgi:hypothetical protein
LRKKTTTYDSNKEASNPISTMVLRTVHTSPSMGNNCLVEVESVLRLRPLSKKEREDSVVLEPLERVGKNTLATAILNPLHSGLASPISGSSLRSRTDSDSASNNVPQEYHFNHVLHENTSQDKIYYTLGLPIATSAMDSLKAATSNMNTPTKTHLLICMGVTHSGKTYTCFGGSSIPKRRASQDGLVPRLVDSLFSQSKHHGNGGSKGFAVQISVTQVAQTKGSDPNACQVQDLLGASSDKTAKTGAMSTPKRSVLFMARNFERSLPSPIRSPMKSSEVAELNVDDLKPTVQNCRDVTHAREILQNGMAASRKAAKGHRNHHLLITMQPVLNGTHFGDKIAILDMAGLEKEKRSQKRGKDSVANSNQEANAAVLHCLRTLIHNTNSMNGKMDPMDIMCPDDMASEISCVSQEKQPFQERLKPVPFRQHKLTMLLNPLFISSASAKITLLLNAYPGHADYYEKKSLLQDFELLCGAGLAAGSARIRTGMGQDEEFLNKSTFDEDDESEDDDSVDQDPVFSRALPSTRQPPKVEPSAHSLTLSASTDASENGMIPMPPAYAPAAPVLQKEPAVSVRRQAHPSAPSADPVAPRQVEKIPAKPRQVEKIPAKQPAQNPKFISDFPGVVMPSKPSSPVSERTKATVIVPSAMVGGPRARAPPFEEEQPRHTVTAPVIPNIKSPRRPREPVSPDFKMPLGRSSLENSSTPEKQSSEWKSSVRATLHNAKNTGKQLISTVKERTMSSPSKDPSSGATKERNTKSSTPSSHISLAEINTSAKPRGAKEDPNFAGRLSPTYEASDSINRKREDVRRQETRIQDVLDQKKALERKCAELEKKNKKLKEALRETGRQQRQSKWTEQDEEEFLQSRRLRLEDQNLVKKPLFEHMKKVSYIYDIKNQWCTTNKKHFGLRFPGRFQRATSLDIRDKMIEERDAALPTTKVSKSCPEMAPVKLHFGANADAKQNEIKEKIRGSLAAKKQRGLSSLQKLANKNKQQRASLGQRTSFGKAY